MLVIDVKGFFQLPNLYMLIKRVYQFPKLWLSGLWQIANIALSKGTFAVATLFNGPEVLSSAFDKAKLLAKNFSKSDDLGTVDKKNSNILADFDTREEV